VTCSGWGATQEDSLHFHCVVIDGVFDVTATGGVVFHAATGLEANAMAHRWTPPVCQAFIQRRREG
jgi:hypothetical protein